MIAATTTSSGKIMGGEIQHDAPWWYRLLARLFPTRCREIPEADNPTWCRHRAPLELGECSICGAPPRIVLRQFAILKRRFYLQQFACSEDPRFMHSHPARYSIVLGLWGRYTERRIAGRAYERVAPYLYTLDGSHVHHVQHPGPGHTSLFLLLGLQHESATEGKRYYGIPQPALHAPDADGPELPETVYREWRDHIVRKVERI